MIFTGLKQSKIRIKIGTKVEHPNYHSTVLNEKVVLCRKLEYLQLKMTPSTKKCLRITIEQLGYDLIDVIYKPSSLFLKIDATKPDILLMDIDLGDDVSGIDLVKEVNERYDIPVIYVTSFADSDTFQKAKKTYPAAYIVKPYTESELQRAIELAINNQQEKTSVDQKI